MMITNYGNMFGFFFVHVLKWFVIIWNFWTYINYDFWFAITMLDKGLEKYVQFVASKFMVRALYNKHISSVKLYGQKD